MREMLNLSKGLYFKNELELERAMFILSEYGFVPKETMAMYYDVEIALSVENKRLAQSYRQLA